MQGKIEIKLITPNTTNQEAFKFHGHATMVILRCQTGDFGILPGRMACSAILGDGSLRIVDEEEKRKIAVLGGVFHFENDVLTIITQKAFLPGEIDITATEIQVKECENRLAYEASAIEKDRIRKELRRAKVLLDVAV